MKWHIDERGLRPNGVEFISRPDNMTSEIWWLGRRIAYWTHKQEIMGGEGLIDWDEVRRHQKKISGVG